MRQWGAMPANLDHKNVQARIIAHNGHHCEVCLAVMDWGVVFYFGNAIEADDAGRVTLIREPFGTVIAAGTPATFEMQTWDIATRVAS